MNDDSLKNAERIAAALIGVLALVWGVVSWKHGVSLLAGGALGLANVTVMRVVMAKVFTAIAREEAVSGFWLFVLVTKFLVLATLLFLCVTVVGVVIAPFTVGLSLVFLAMVGSALRQGIHDSDPPAAAGLLPSASDGRMS
jgi:hypothetical protein